MRERVKNTALAGLFVLMLVLLYFSMTLGVSTEGGSLSRILGVSPQETPSELEPQPAVQLRTLAMCTPAGVHMPESYDEKQEMETAVSTLYTEAVGSAQAGVQVTQEEYLELLQNPAVYLGFDTELPFFLLRRWAGLEAGERESRLTGLVLGLSDGSVVLAWRDAETGQYHMAQTAAAADRLQQVCSAWQGNNAVFAFEEDGLSALCADEPVLLSAVQGRSYTVKSPAFVQAGELSREVLSGFGFNPYLARVYEQDGEIVYVEGYNALGYNVLRVGTNGDLVYTSGAEGQGISLGLPEESGDNLSMAVEGVRVLLNELSEKAGAQGVYSLSELDEQEDGGLVLLFDLTLSGCAVLSERPGAQVTVRGGQVVSLYMSPRSYEEADMYALLPARQAAAALPQQSACYRLSVRYSEKQEGLLVPVLCSTEESNGME